MITDPDVPMGRATTVEGLELDDVARRLCWWQSPVEARRDPIRFVAQVMAIGTDRDVEALARVWGEDVFDTVLDAPPPGLFTARRWNYWHVRRNQGFPAAVDSGVDDRCS
jgi:hypothetical protein